MSEIGRRSGAAARRRVGFHGGPLSGSHGTLLSVIEMSRDQLRNDARF
jgi:hypothetical protein